MGNTSAQGGNKGSTSSTNTGAPAWAPTHAGGKPVVQQPGGGTLQPGTDAYKNANTQLQTGPIQAANEVIGNRGLGQTSQNVINSVMGGGGANNWMNQAANTLQNPGQISAGQIGQQNYQGIYDRAGQPGAAEQYLTGTAQGQYLGGSPYLDDIVAKSSQNVADQTNQMFAAGGRYGSAAHQGTVADAVASNANNLRNQNYQAERDRQMSAAGTLESAQQGRLGVQSGAAGGIANVQGQNIGNSMTAQGQNIANRLNAAGQLGGLGQQAMGNQFNAAGLENAGMGNLMSMMGLLPTIQNNKTFDADKQMGIGGMIDNRTQQGLNDLINQWSQTDMAPWARLGGLLSVGTGSAGGWGTQTQKTTQPMNPMGILGALISAIPGV